MFCINIVRREEDSNKVREDWKYVAIVLYRLFLWIFTVAVIGEELELVSSIVIICIYHGYER